MKKISGKIVRGKGRGKGFGFPTANVVLKGVYLARNPVSSGVYACWVTVCGKRFASATSVGVNEMFGEKSPTIEAHLLDFSGDIYGENVEIEFVKRLREMQRFPTVSALQEQMEMDVQQVRIVLSTLHSSLKGN